MKQIDAVPFDRSLSEAERTVVREWLETHGAALVELYDSFNRLLEDESIPGRARLIGHCVREIRSNLLEQIVAKKSPSLQYPVELKAIAEKARQEGGGRAPTATDSDPNVPDVAPSLGPQASSMFWDLVKRSGTLTANVFDEIVELFRKLRIEPSGPDMGLGPIAEDFKRVSGTHNIAHTRKTDDQLLSPELNDQINSFDGYLHKFATSKEFVEGLEPIDAILEETNQPAD